jgi:hypothetical protein
VAPVHGGVLLDVVYGVCTSGWVHVGLVSLVGFARRQPPVAQRRAQRLPAACYQQVAFLRDVVTGRTRVKEIAAVADPLVSNLTTRVLGTPLGGPNTPDGR